MGRNQMPLQLEAIHFRHGDIEDHAGDARKFRGLQEIAGRGEDRRTEPDQREQTVKSFAERLIVIDDRD